MNIFDAYRETDLFKISPIVGRFRVIICWLFGHDNVVIGKKEVVDGLEIEFFCNRCFIGMRRRLFTKAGVDSTVL